MGLTTEPVPVQMETGQRQGIILQFLMLKTGHTPGSETATNADGKLSFCFPQ